jgi:short-subunit dehydrogenase
MAKIAITGHTQGIGKGLYNYYSTVGEVKGYSRTNGYDLSDLSTIDRILLDSNDCDIFINNAYYPVSQNVLATTWLSQNTGKNKLLINIGSMLAEVARVYPESDLVVSHQEYVRNKTELLKLSLKQSLTTSNPRVILIAPAFVDTAMLPTTDEFCNQLRASGKILSVSTVVDIITNVVQKYRDNVYCPYICIGNS